MKRGEGRRKWDGVGRAGGVVPQGMIWPSIQNMYKRGKGGGKCGGDRGGGREGGGMIGEGWVE